MYWLNGAAPLAVLLRDARPVFFADVRRAVHQVLAQFAPAGNATRFLAAYDDQLTPRADVWSAFRLMSALAQWADGVPDDGDRVDTAVDGWLRELSGYLDARGGLGPGMGWAYFRWNEAVAVTLWRARRVGHGQGQRARAPAVNCKDLGTPLTSRTRTAKIDPCARVGPPARDCAALLPSQTRRLRPGSRWRGSSGARS